MENLYWHQRLTLGQSYTVTHKTAEQGLTGVCPPNNKSYGLTTRRTLSFAAMSGRLANDLLYSGWQ